MKSNILFLFFAFLFTLPLSAQKEQEAPKVNLRGMEKILNPEQIEMLKAQNKLVRAQRKAFKNSLVKEQLAIMESETLRPYERRKALMASLNQEQRDLLKT
ncbi:MAG: hypothetical protein ACPF80_04705, partial [Flavobacteriaceae bacterium]